MPAKLYGIEHFTYIGITTALAVAILLFAKKFAKTEKAQTIVLKSIALALFVSILALYRFLATQSLSDKFFCLHKHSILQILVQKLCKRGSNTADILPTAKMTKKRVPCGTLLKSYA